MADLAFIHGSTVTESGETPILIKTKRTNVIAILGTAPEADLSKFPYNTPVLVKGGADISTAKALGNTGTLKKQLDAVLDHIGAYVYIINVEEGSDYNDTLSNMVGDVAALSGVHALKKAESLYGRHLRPRIICAPGFTHIGATDGIVSVNTTVSGSGYVDPVVTIAGDGAGAEAIAIVVDGAISEIVVTKPGYGYTAVTVQLLLLLMGMSNGKPISITLVAM
jgi:phage tail sheath protein FI